MVKQLTMAEVTAASRLGSVSLDSQKTRPPDSPNGDKPHRESFAWLYGQKTVWINSNSD